MVLDRRRRVDHRLEVSGCRKTKESSMGRPEILQVSLGRRTKLARRNTELDEMGEIGRSYLADPVKWRKQVGT